MMPHSTPWTNVWLRWIHIRCNTAELIKKCVCVSTPCDSVCDVQGPLSHTPTEKVFLLITLVHCKLGFKAGSPLKLNPLQASLPHRHLLWFKAHSTPCGSNSTPCDSQTPCSSRPINPLWFKAHSTPCGSRPTQPLVVHPLNPL